ncbi:protein adenylyltransferase SelO [Piscicoccus intestinalis]|uniref:protein adenylyltransferase SelO n=1 Tax=Piscicoccus intestinalis TaxID=746033 RepID=UPI0008393958|nr:YdiU family protein [Piscicoccus intestinalis]
MSETATLVRLEDTYARAVPELSLQWRAAPTPAPRLTLLNDELADELGLDPDSLHTPTGLEFLLGHESGGVATVAQVYAGHQFGGYSPRLGDGRALLLGELVDPARHRHDLHLKGSGRTPFARGGDGKAVLGPMLREYLMGEAMHALGIPTTRALAVATTGESVMRDRGYQPGAVLCRVADSHLRVGTFQYAAATGDADLLRRLADYAITRHHPQAAGADNPYLDLLDRVAAAQAELVAAWMQVGFIHGVMNTDNMAISGQTIDYGPCAFMDAYDPTTVFSSIDHGGRYAYGNQPGIAQWNLARFAETLLPLIDADPQAAIEPATEVLNSFARRYDEAAARGMRAKLGLVETDRDLVSDVLGLLREQRVDLTTFFRALAAGTAAELFADPAPFEEWARRREAALPADRGAVTAAMNRLNPVYIPRNHRVEEALDAATAGDLGPFHRLLEAVRAPYEPRREFADLADPAPSGAPPHVTFCGT